VRDRPPPLLLAVPNVSEGREPSVLEALSAAFAPPGGPVRVLDRHVDPDHGRAVYTLAARQGELADALLAGGRAALEGIDVSAHAGRHPHVGALDVAPVVYLEDRDRGAACAEALTAAALIGEELEIPVFLYGQLATAAGRVERADLRAGGPAGLAERLRAGELRPDYGPPHVHPTAGATLVTARPPLLAFNVDLASDDVDLARRIAAVLRESGGGLPGVRAIGLHLPARGRAQVSTNVHDHRAVPLRAVVEAVAAHAEVAEAEIVGLVPSEALEGFPPEVPLRGFDPSRHVIENALRSRAHHGPDPKAP
jgi:glutamate formiminotransferase/glutamate formiminotransferase/formiminotetrahydrofolate cyclodeaminase